MRILFVSTSTALGGAERSLFYLAKGLKEQGHTVKVISVYPKGSVADELEKSGIETVALNERYVPCVSTIFKLNKEIKKFKPDVVHAQLYRAVQMCRFLKNKSFKLITAPHTNYKAKSFFPLLLDKILAHNDDVSLSESISTVHFLVDKQKYKKDKIFLLLNEPEPKYKENAALRAAARKELKAGDKTIFICVARLSKEKGQRYLLEAFQKVRAENEKTALWLVGDGPEEENLKNLNCPGVEFLGVKNNVEKYLNGADVFVLPSLSESRPIALLEALNCGLPAVATGIGDNGSIYVHGKTGFICRPKDAVLLACFLREMCLKDVREKFKKEILNGRETVSNRYCDAYLGVVGKMASQK